MLFASCVNQLVRRCGLSFTKPLGEDRAPGDGRGPQAARKEPGVDDGRSTPSTGEWRTSRYRSSSRASRRPSLLISTCAVGIFIVTASSGGRSSSRCHRARRHLSHGRSYSSPRQENFRRRANGRGVYGLIDHDCCRTVQQKVIGERMLERWPHPPARLINWTRSAR